MIFSRRRMLTFLLCISHQLAPLSFVYNLRISEGTRYPYERLRGAYLMNFTAANQHRTRNDGSFENAGGIIGSFSYNRPKWYIRGDFAVAHDKNTVFTGSAQSGVQTDDILITFGTPYSFNKRARCTLSGLVGFPTHKDKSFIQSQFGISHYALGIQGDGQWAYYLRADDTLTNSLQAAVRFLHFFPRHTLIPIIPKPACFDFNLGNILDLLVSHRTQFERNGFEFGYNATMLLGATVEPALPIVSDKIKGTRSSFYAVYSHLMPLRDKAHGINVGLSYGFDHDNNLYNIRRGFTAWFSWGINF